MTQYPDEYRETAQKLMTLGQRSAQEAGVSLSLKDLEMHPDDKKRLEGLRARVRAIGESNLPHEQQSKQIIDMVLKESPELEKSIYEHGLASGNQLAQQVQSGSRGNPMQLKQLLAGDMLVQDHRDRIIPVPILHGYAHSLDPVEYFSAAYGARKGTTATKLGTAKAGFVQKQGSLINHRLVVTEKDCGTQGGLPVRGDDSGNLGAVLAQDAAGHQAGTVISKDMLSDFGETKIMVRSPIACASHHGVCSKCVGVREKGRLPEIGDNVGIAASQALFEPLAASTLGTKHTGGAVSGRKVEFSGFDAINSLLQAPGHFTGMATLADKDGIVTGIKDAPQGGKYVHIGDHEHYVPSDLDVTVKKGQEVEAGTPLSEGAPSPSQLAQHRGIGEGRRQFVDLMGKTLKDSGIPAHRRNVELLARGLINHVQIDHSDNDSQLADDVIPYENFRTTYRPREGSAALSPEKAIGKYLEAPALHLTIGTRITPSVAKELGEMKIPQVLVHDDEPNFHPRMVRGMEAGLRDPNWQTRLAGGYLERGFLDAVHRGESAPIHDTSYVGSLAQGTEFGRDIKTTGMY
jgi:DNA-directed RNA polymerase subunit beta'